MSTRSRISVEEFDAMIARGDFVPGEKHRVELIRGEIIPIDPRGPMSSIDLVHEDTVDELLAWSYEALWQGVFRLRIQGSLTIPELNSQPEPDVLWMDRKRYWTAKPRPADIRLLIEVSDTTLAKDRGEKADLYAEASIPDYWIINLPARCVEVRRDPIGMTHRSITTYQIGQMIHPLAFPNVSLAVSRLFPD